MCERTWKNAERFLCKGQGVFTRLVCILAPDPDPSGNIMPVLKSDIGIKRSLYSWPASGMQHACILVAMIIMASWFASYIRRVRRRVDKSSTYRSIDSSTARDVCHAVFMSWLLNTAAGNAAAVFTCLVAKSRGCSSALSSTSYIFKVEFDSCVCKVKA